MTLDLQSATVENVIRELQNKNYDSLENYTLPDLEKIAAAFREKTPDFQAPTVHVICIKWGTYYGPADVNHLYRSICRYTLFHHVEFYCFTDNGAGLDPEIHIKPLPQLQVAPEDNRYSYRKEAALCDDTLGGLTGKRVFFFDLDSLIVGPLDAFWAYPKDDKFYIINDWKHRKGKKANQVGQASCYSFVVGTLGFVKSFFEAHPKEMVERFYTASQEYLSYKVIEKFGALNFWPDNWFKSYRFHCMPMGVFRWFFTPKLPKIKGLKMVAFHGQPGIEEAIQGIWSANPKDPKYPRGYKKIYKHVKPAPWIQDYWK